MGSLWVWLQQCRVMKCECVCVSAGKSHTVRLLVRIEWANKMERNKKAKWIIERKGEKLAAYTNIRAYTQTHAQTHKQEALRKWRANVRGISILPTQNLSHSRTREKEKNVQTHFYGSEIHTPAHRTLPRVLVDGDSLWVDSTAQYYCSLSGLLFFRQTGTYNNVFYAEKEYSNGMYS